MSNIGNLDRFQGSFAKNERPSVTTITNAFPNPSSTTGFASTGSCTVQGIIVDNCWAVLNIDIKYGTTSPGNFSVTFEEAAPQSASQAVFEVLATEEFNAATNCLVTVTVEINGDITVTGPEAADFYQPFRRLNFTRASALC